MLDFTKANSCWRTNTRRWAIGTNQAWKAGLQGAVAGNKLIIDGVTDGWVVRAVVALVVIGGLFL